MLEIYIQEVASLTVLTNIGVNERQKIQDLAKAAPYLLRDACQRLPALVVLPERYL